MVWKAANRGEGFWHAANAKVKFSLQVGDAKTECFGAGRVKVSPNRREHLHTTPYEPLHSARSSLPEIFPTIIMASSCSTCTLTQMDSGDCTENLYQSTYATSVEHVSRDSDSSEDGNTESDDSDDSEDGRYIESETRDKPVIVDVPCCMCSQSNPRARFKHLTDKTRSLQFGTSESTASLSFSPS
jgi:hypothetical protein